MEYTQKSIIFEYLDYDSLMKMIDADEDYKSFTTVDNLFKKMEEKYEPYSNKN